MEEKNKVIDWLLEDKNPAVKYRTLTEILNQPADISDSKEWIMSKLPKNWHETKGLWYCYYITAIAECGLSYHDLPEECLRQAFNQLDAGFGYGCGGFMLLRSLIKLGCYDEKSVQNAIKHAGESILPDGGFLCLHRLHKLSYTPKSCYKANLHALLLAAECKKKEIDIPFIHYLIEYFKNHHVFYRTDDQDKLVLDARPGWRPIDTFYPFEVMRVGLQNIVEAFSALDLGNEPWLDKAWDLLHSGQDDSGRTILQGTLTKSYLPKEHVGKPSKWVSFYTLLAEKEKIQTSCSSHSY